MIDRTAKLSVGRQAKVLGISRGSVYYKPRPVSDADLKLMHRIDRLHMEFPFAGSHWIKLRPNSPLERIMREIRRRTRVAGAFPDGKSCLTLAAAWSAPLGVDMPWRTSPRIMSLFRTWQRNCLSAAATAYSLRDRKIKPIKPRGQLGIVIYRRSDL